MVMYWLLTAKLGSISHNKFARQLNRAQGRMISFRHRIAFATLLLILNIGAANAADDSFSDMPVVLSDDKLEQTPSRSPVAISSVDRDMIEASGARTIPDVLRMVPGVEVAQADSSTWAVTSRGSNGVFAKT